MTLIMKTAKGAAIFEWADEDAETVVKIEPTDEDEVMVRKLKRVIALVEGEQAEPRLNVTKYPTMRPVAAERTEAVPSTIANGWAAYGAPKVPEHLAGEVELVQPGEGA